MALVLTNIRGTGSARWRRKWRTSGSGSRGQNHPRETQRRVPPHRCSRRPEPCRQAWRHHRPIREGVPPRLPAIPYPPNQQQRLGCSTRLHDGPRSNGQMHPDLPLVECRAASPPVGPGRAPGCAENRAPDQVSEPNPRGHGLTGNVEGERRRRQCQVQRGHGNVGGVAGAYVCADRQEEVGDQRGRGGDAHGFPP